MTALALQRMQVVGLALAMMTVCGLAVSLPAEAQTRPALVRDIDSPTLQPFRLTQFCGSTQGATITCQPATVPAGKRLVIEFVGLYADGGNGDPVNSLRLRVGGQSFNNGFVIAVKPEDLAPQPNGGAYNAAFNQLVKLYFEQGEIVEVSAFYKNDTNSVKNLQINLQGYYVTLP